MTAPTTEPPPSALDVLRCKPIGEMSSLEIFITMCDCPLDNYPDQFAQKAATELATLRSERDEARGERDALRGQIASIERNLIGAVSLLHGGKVRITKLEADAQPEKFTP